MKKIIYVFLLSLVGLIYPIYAETSSINLPTIVLNHITYSPRFEPQIHEDMLYLSGDDLAALTYGRYEHTDSEDKLTVQNQKLVYTKNSTTILLDSITKTLKHPTLEVNDTIYLPLCILDELSYPYTYSEKNHSLSIVPLMPYSTATDNYSTHTTIPSSYKTFEDILTPLVDQDETSRLMNELSTNKCYISFMTTNHKSRAFEAMAPILEKQRWDGLKTMVHLRQLDTSKSLPTISTFKTFEAAYKLRENGLEFFLNGKSCPNPFFWATYKEPTSIDINKSLDAMILRCIYVYYRDLYNLKDDIITSPITTIQMGRSDSVSYHVYLEDGKHNPEYQVLIYKMYCSNCIHYYVDFIG